VKKIDWSFWPLLECGFDLHVYLLFLNFYFLFFVLCPLSFGMSASYSSKYRSKYAKAPVQTKPVFVLKPNDFPSLGGAVPSATKESEAVLKPPSLKPTLTFSERLKVANEQEEQRKMTDRQEVKKACESYDRRILSQVLPMRSKYRREDEYDEYGQDELETKEGDLDYVTPYNVSYIRSRIKEYEAEPYDEEEVAEEAEY